MPPPKKSGLSRAWDFANKGLISPETVMAPFGTTPQEQLARQSSLDPNEGFWERFARGAAADTASTLSSFTSPLSVALFGAGAAAKALPAAGKLAQVARGVSATAGMGFGAQGLAQAGSGVQDMYRNGITPANVQQTLGGASQAAFAGHGAASGFKQGASMPSSLAQSIFENHQANGGATFTNKGLLDKGAAVGTWNDTSTGQHYLDVSGVTPDRSTAVRLGQQYNQKSAFDLHGLQEVPTGGTGESIPNLPALDQRMAQLSQPAPQMVGSQAGANADTGFFQQASSEMPNASLSQKLLRAQELKAKGAAAGVSDLSQPTGMDIDAQFRAHPPQDSAGQNLPPLQPQFWTFSPQEIQAPPFPHEQYNAALVQADQIKTNLTRLNSQLQGFKGPQNSPLDIDPDRVDPNAFQNPPPGVLRVRPEQMPGAAPTPASFWQTIQAATGNQRGFATPDLLTGGLLSHGDTDFDPSSFGQEPGPSNILSPFGTTAAKRFTSVVPNKITQHLTPGWQNLLKTPQSQQTMLDMRKQMASPEEVEAAAQLGQRSSYNWYPMSRELGNTLEDAGTLPQGANSNLFHGLLASTSPQTNVPRNLAESLELMHNVKTEQGHGGFDPLGDPSQFKNWLESSPLTSRNKIYLPNGGDISLASSKRLNLNRAVNNEPLGGMKVSSFWGDLNQGNFGTMDSISQKGMGTPEFYSGSPFRPAPYMAARSRMSEVAQQHGVSVDQIQASQWTPSRMINDSSALQQMSPDEAISHISNALDTGSPNSDFASIALDALEGKHNADTRYSGWKKDYERVNQALRQLHGNDQGQLDDFAASLRSRIKPLQEERAARPLGEPSRKPLRRVVGRTQRAIAAAGTADEE